jgi:glutamine amidotransferase-like uncharacterized protein
MKKIWMLIAVAALVLTPSLSLFAAEAKRKDALEPDRREGPIAVALFDGDGASANLCNTLSKAVDRERGIKLTRIGVSDIRVESLKQFDVVIFPGGYASKQGNAIGEQGCAAVNQFVKDGGGYLGICAGAYLATSRFPVSFELFDGSMVRGRRRAPEKGTRPRTRRGSMFSKQKVELTEKGKEIFPNLPASFQMVCVAGPVFAPKDDESSPPYETLALFRTQSESGRGAVINNAAIITSQFGSGRVMAISPHPELSKGLGSMIPAAIRWVSKREPERRGSNR